MSDRELDRIRNTAYGWAWGGATETDNPRHKGVELRAARHAILGNQGDGDEDAALEEGFNEGWAAGLAHLARR